MLSSVPMGVACRLATQNGFVWRKGEGTAGRLFSFICNSSRYHECKTLDYIFLLHVVMLASGTYYSRLNVGCTYVAVP